MKFFLFFLLFTCSLSAICQTVHIKDDKINYSGKVKVEGVSKDEILKRAAASLQSLMDNYTIVSEDKNATNEISLRGETKMKTPYALIRKMIYTFTVSTDEKGYRYHIDSVYVSEQARGEKAKIESSEKLIKQMTESGNPAINAEKILNEIDMNFQKMLAMLKNKISAGAK